MVRSLCITVLLALCLPSAVMAADAGHNGKVCTPLSAWVSLPYSGVVDEVLSPEDISERIVRIVR